MHRSAVPGAFALFLSLSVGWAVAPGAAQTGSSSSSSSSATGRSTEDANPVARPRVAQIEPGGAAVTLETSEPLFQVATALNACGYDTDLERSAPVRARVRQEVNDALAESESARASRDALCKYVNEHRLTDHGLDIGQYVSLALYLSPAPELTPNVDETELPPQATQVVNVLPLLRTFAEETKLHIIWIRNRAAYEALTARVHDPMTRMILDTNIYLHLPVSSYDGRRFLVLLEPMLAPSLTNARIYGSDYIVVTSPDASTGDPVRMDQIRHIYLHYLVEPMVYSRGQAMEHIQPMLRGVQDAPIEFFYKSDVVALLTECLIKAIEAHVFVIDGPKPKKPSAVKARTEMAQYEEAKAAYDRETASQQAKLVHLDEAGGWTLTGYFYQALGQMEHSGDGLRDEIARMVYGMDVDRERHHAEEIVFIKGISEDPLRPSARPRVLNNLDLAEADLAGGKPDDAADLAEKALASASGDHGRAQYILARVALTHGRADDARSAFEQALTLSKDPRTVAWSHIYLGRLYDSMRTPDREHAVAEYKAALASRDSRPDTKLAAESGIKKPFALPQRAAPPKPAEDDSTFDPTGKAEKEAYKPQPQ